MIKLRSVSIEPLTAPLALLLPGCFAFFAHGLIPRLLPSAHPSIQIVDLVEMDLPELLTSARAANSRGAMDEVSHFRIERGRFLGEVRRVHVQIDRAWDMASGILLRRAHIQDDVRLGGAHFLKRGHIDIPETVTARGFAGRAGG